MGRDIQCTGDELYNLTKSFINYHGQEGTNSQDALYSVKNIKTIVISPKAIMFEYHLDIGAKPCSTAIRLAVRERAVPRVWMHHFKSPEEFTRWVNAMKPNRAIVDAIGSGTNKCQGLQEIVLVPYEDGLSLSSKDSDMREFLNELISKKANRRGTDDVSLVRDLIDYYPRLRCISLSNSINSVVQAFLMRSANKDDVVYKTLAEYGTFSDTMKVNEDDWYSTTKFSAKYPYDLKLESTFDTIKATYDRSKKESKLDDIRKKRISGVLEEYDEYANKYSALMRVCTALYKIQESDGMYDVHFNFAKTTSDKVIRKEDEEHLKNAIEVLKKSIVDNITAFYVSLIKVISITGEKTRGVVFKEPYHLVLPPSFGIPQELSGIKGLTISNGSPSNDILAKNIAFFCENFTSCNEKYTNKAIWEGVLKDGRH